MAELEGVLRFNQVRLVEMEAATTGPAPGIRTRFIYTDDEGRIYGETQFETPSARSLRLFDALSASLEDDLAKCLVHPTEGTAPSEEEQVADQIVARILSDQGESEFEASEDFGMLDGSGPYR